MTNDVEAARAFWREHDGEVIFKQFLALPETFRETRRLRPADEAFADSIAHAPVIFQRNIPAMADIGATAIGGTFYAAATDVRKAKYPQDVRMNLVAKYEAHELPPERAEKLRQLMNQLGLVYGAIDLRLTPEGRYVFLEINPAGQFLYIEQATGQPIAAAVAQTLSTSQGRRMNWEAIMSKAFATTLFALWVAVLYHPSPALAGPVSDADLRGKTICWSYGGTRNIYGKDGSLDSNLVGHGTWNLAGDRITEHGDHGVFSFTIEKRAGTLHMYGRSPGGGWVDVTGSYCK